MLADGTYAVTDTKKITTILKDAVQMSGEWHKWHAYNFILASLTDELIALGAKPTVKIKVLWIWVRYIKKFQQKEEPEATQFESNSLNGEDKEELSEEDIDKEDIDEFDDYELNKTKKTKKKDPDKQQYDINNITKGILLTILYVALNLDKSDIQLTHLFQFIREGRLSIYNCSKYVPKELSVKLIPNWQNFNYSTTEYTIRTIRAYAMTLFKRLQLGVPLVPDLNKIIDNYIKELCLPEDFKDLVISLIALMPCDSLQMDNLSMKHYIYTPDYETLCMSYVLLALKTCFGLDCDYETKLSDAVDRINCEEDYLKSYKLGMYSEPTDRLFSFREWYMFMQLRKMILSKYFLPMARQFNLHADDSVFMEHLEERKKRKIRLSDDVTMDILNKIPLDETTVIPKSQFPVSLTPMSTYTEVILEYINDPDLKLRLCEDFTKYSLKYATRDLKLPGYNISSEYLIAGVDDANKIINRCIVGTLTAKVGDPTLVLVRNCDNKNWLKTRPPKVKHVTIINSNRTDNDCISSSDSVTERNESGSDDEECTKHSGDEESWDVIEEEDEEVCIYDDDFKNLQIEDEKEDDKKYSTSRGEMDRFEFQNNNLYDSKTYIHDSFSEVSAQEIVFNPETFDREKVIQELIEMACKQYKIPIPEEKEERRPIKRKSFVNNQAGASEPKKKKNFSKPGEAAKIRQGLIDAYYENINNDVLLKVSDHVRSCIELTENQEECNATNNSLNNQTEEIGTRLPQNSLAGEISALSQNYNDENFRGDTNVTSIDQNASVHDSSVQDETMNGTIDDDDEENNIEEVLPQTNPNFDPKTHDIKQLYVNIKEQIDLQDIGNMDVNDPDVENIIDKKIAEFKNFDKNYNRDDTENENDKLSEKSEPNDTNESDEDLLDDKLSYLRNRDKSNLEYLVQNSSTENFRYWMKHYKTRVFIGSNTMTQKFNLELEENCPKSFVFVITECAFIAECTAFALYKRLQRLEERLTSHIDKL
ncbi:jg20959 [Pararge aegeria aegeria]|uniref:Jg20959 protein n=1 Tax=Pararge aegeria aegeria TaxID=348720 RepID=A0A8S4RBS9_9NEOP|nr:jg20959 [Pararge aegeria aegeria]